MDKAKQEEALKKAEADAKAKETQQPDTKQNS